MTIAAHRVGMRREHSTAEMTQPGLLTAEEFLHLSFPDKRTELVRGVLRVREPAGYLHGEIAMRLGAVIHNHVEQHALGRVFAAETGFMLRRKPDTVRAPDVAFVVSARLLDPPPRGFAELAPDLAVEVLSPDDRPAEVLEKVAEWLRAGVRLVWVVDPARETVHVYRADGRESVLRLDDELEGEDVLPGFRLSLNRLFPGQHPPHS